MRNFNNIKEIYESSDEKEVNYFLSKEWQLLEIYHKNTGIQINQVLPVYILGRPENNPLKLSDIKSEIEKLAKKNFEAYCNRLPE